MPKYIDLINEISDNDKATLTDYITTYGAKDFIGLDKWLQDWSHSNQKLYKLLGNKLIHSFDIEYEKSSRELEREFHLALVQVPKDKEISFKSMYHNFYWDYFKATPAINDVKENISFFNHLLDMDNFITGDMPYGIKYKKANAQKMLQIQPGTKILKAIGRVLDYFKDDYPFDMELFEEFKKQFAIINTKKKIKTKACISIHPLDYITMSDNASNWQSCMNWTDESTGGCYHVGTVEMMNSNNVLCCYMVNPNKPYVFDTKTINPETGELIGVWNNKTWRQLFYITKDILMGGKPYPYRSKDITILILNEIKRLALDNLHWDYKFGPELYQDMVHVNSKVAMENQRQWMRIEKKNPMKHNIIWDTRGMYNDMLNDSLTEYWCYRNKVNHTKIISASGKANCLCCNNDVLKVSDYDERDYNYRYSNTGDVVCSSCMKNYKCDYCCARNPRYSYTTLPNGKHICSDCAERYLKVCPCCGKIYYSEYEFCFNENKYHLYYNPLISKDPTIITNKDPEVELRYKIISSFSIERDSKDMEIFECYTLKDEDRNCMILPMESLWACPDCCSDDKVINTLQKNAIAIKANKHWGWMREKKDDIIYIVNPNVANQYRYINLKAGKVDAYIEQIKKEIEEKEARKKQEEEERIKKEKAAANNKWTALNTFYLRTPSSFPSSFTIERTPELETAILS